MHESLDYLSAFSVHTFNLKRMPGWLYCLLVRVVYSGGFITAQTDLSVSVEATRRLRRGPIAVLPSAWDMKIHDHPGALFALRLKIPMLKAEAIETLR